MSDMPIAPVESTLLPRLATSRQWTTLPAEFLKKVRAVFEGQFPIETDLGEFIIDGRIYTGEIILRIGYVERGRLKQVNFEASTDLQPLQEATTLSDDKPAHDSKTMDRLFVCIDALGSVLEEYFDLGEGEERDAIDIPLHWSPYDFDGDTVYLRHSTVNTRLEDEADRILALAAGLTGPAEKRLVHEQALSEDALANAEIDSDLAFEIQKAIRSGEYPRPASAEANEEEYEN
jgi:hypothetical protein